MTHQQLRGKAKRYPPIVKPHCSPSFQIHHPPGPSVRDHPVPGPETQPRMPCRAWAASLRPLLAGSTALPQSLPLLAKPACGRTRTGCPPWIPTASNSLQPPRDVSEGNGNCHQDRQDSSLSWDDTPGTATPEKGPRTARPTPAAALAKRSSPRAICQSSRACCP